MHMFDHTHFHFRVTSLETDYSLKIVTQNLFPIIVLVNGPYAKFLNRAHLFLKRGAGDLIFTICDCYGLNTVMLC